MHTSPPLSLTPGERALQSALALLWFGLIPALLAALVLRFAWPSPLSTESEWLRALAAAPFVAGALLFGLLAVLLRYWRSYLPGGRYLGALPPSLAQRLASEVFSTVLLLGVVGGAALLLRAHAFQICRVLSSSMLPQLEPGDYLLATKGSYSSPHALPKRGSIVVFHRASERGNDELIKRVIGLPGDVIAAPNGFPTINGWEVPHCDAGRYTEITPQGTTDGRLLVEFLEDQVYLAVYTPLTRAAAEYTVKPDEVFVFGDNRNESLDSRFWNNGKPSGLALSKIDGEVTRRLSDVRRDQTPTFGRFLQPLNLAVRVQGVDTSKLQTGIQQCLASPPTQTHPPESSSVRP